MDPSLLKLRLFRKRRMSGWGRLESLTKTVFTKEHLVKFLKGGLLITTTKETERGEEESRS
jgi:hypothetical protein